MEEKDIGSKVDELLREYNGHLYKQRKRTENVIQSNPDRNPTIMQVRSFFILKL